MVSACDITVFTFTIISSNIPLLVYWLANKKKNKIPHQWQKVGTLKKIIIYPLKSGEEYHLSEGDCCKYGLKEIRNDHLFPLRDRCIIVYNAETKEFTNAKKNFKLMFVAAESISSHQIRLTAPNTPELVIKVPLTKSREFFSMYHDEMIRTKDCGNAASTWITTYLNDGKTYRIGVWPDNIRFGREEIPVKWKKYVSLYPHLKEEYAGMYADIAGYMATNEASLEDLNERLKQNDVTVSQRNFRPNFVFDGMGKYEENDYDWFKIGDSAIFRSFKPCTRCVITTADPETGERNPHQEPIKTLRKYRALKNPTASQLENYSPVFGAYLGIVKTGHVKVGDPIYVNKENNSQKLVGNE